MISGGEIFVILLFAFLLFGSERFPKIARDLGRGVREFKKATENIKDEILNSDIQKDISSATQEVKKDLSDIYSELKDPKSNDKN